MQVMNLWRREAVQLKTGILSAQGTQKIFVPLDSEIRMQSALHQHARAAQRNRFIDLGADFVNSADVSIGRARPAIESAERADHVADIRVVDVAIDYVSNDVVGMTLPANLVSSNADARDVERLQQYGAVTGVQPLSLESLVQDWLNLSLLHGLSLLIC